MKKSMVMTAVLALATAIASAAAAAEAGSNYGKIVNAYAPAVAAEGQNVDEYEARASRTGYWIVGAGAAVDKMPIAASEFTLPLIYAAYESINKKSIGDCDFAWSFGLYDFMPEIEFAIEIPAKPMDFRLSVGGFYDVIIGGTLGMICKAGVIFNKTMQFDIMLIPIGTQPTVSYSESLRQQHIVLNDGTHGLNFPVFGILLGIRI